MIDIGYDHSPCEHCDNLESGEGGQCPIHKKFMDSGADAGVLKDHARNIKIRIIECDCYI